MHAQLIEGGTTPDRRAEMDRVVSDQMLPALKLSTGTRRPISVWEVNARA